MAGKFDHFLITRFNLKSDQNNWKTADNRSIASTGDWLDHRIELFQEYCLPSVINQSNKDFTWLIYLDSETTHEYRQKIENLTNGYSLIKLRYADNYGEFIAKHTSDIIHIKSPDKEYIITSRIDNDDVVHFNYIDTVQKQFENQEFMAVNFIKTYHYKIIQPEKLYLNYRFSNQFISIIEKIKNRTLHGCYARGDRFWNKKGEIIQISKGIFCMELIHEKNLLNNLNGFPVAVKKDLNDFQINKKICTRTLKDFLRIWKMSWKKYLIYLIKY
ncbi:MAG: hypothetical protein JW894_13745 [Bacteroidales bacterium]|nr:hypothetical protein [Bacteroidales bacterium]